jgi:hypothetical protein
VVGVEADEDVVLFRQAMRGLGEDDGTKGLSLRAVPEANSPPPVETWMMPSDLDSAKAFKAPLMVVMEVTLIAG